MHVEWQKNILFGVRNHTSIADVFHFEIRIKTARLADLPLEGDMSGRTERGDALLGVLPKQAK